MIANISLPIIKNLKRKLEALNAYVIFPLLVWLEYLSEYFLFLLHSRIIHTPFVEKISRKDSKRGLLLFLVSRNIKYLFERFPFQLLKLPNNFILDRTPTTVQLSRISKQKFLCPISLARVSSRASRSMEIKVRRVINREGSCRTRRRRRERNERNVSKSRSARYVTRECKSVFMNEQGGGSPVRGKGMVAKAHTDRDRQ